MPVTKNRLYLLILCSLFAALCAIGAFIKVPLAWLPITLQTFFSTLAGLLLGKKWGTVSVVVYLLLGLIGLPIFTQGGGIGYVQSGATVRLKGGDFSGNSSAAGSQYDGLFLKPYNKNLTAEVHIAKLNQDLTVWTNQTSKTVNNTWLVLESPLTHKVILNDSYRIADTIVVKGTDSYTLTESDLANLIPGDDAIAFYRDAENNAIRIRAVE